MLIQRGAKYRVTKAEIRDGKYYFEMEVRIEKDYDLFQQDENEWKGSRVNYRGEDMKGRNEL